MPENARPPKKRGPAPMKFSAHQREQARKMAAYGLTQEQTADVLGINEETLKKRLAPEFKAGLVDYDAAVVNNLRRHALGEGPGAVTAAIYWTKTRLGWSEKSHLHISFDIAPLVAGFLNVLHRAIPEFCPGCKTALALKPKLAEALMVESRKFAAPPAPGATTFGQSGSPAAAAGGTGA